MMVRAVVWPVAAGPTSKKQRERVKDAPPPNPKWKAAMFPTKRLSLIMQLSER
jgi:hypothetical protein